MCEIFPLHHSRRSYLRNNRLYHDFRSLEVAQVSAAQVGSKQVCFGIGRDHACHRAARNGCRLYIKRLARQFTRKLVDSARTHRTRDGWQLAAGPPVGT